MTRSAHPVGNDGPRTLYNAAILRLATTIPHHARLASPHASAERRSPICGSRVIVDIALNSAGTISEIGLEVRACALGQAAASIMARHAVGRSVIELDQACEALADFLSGGRAEPGSWPGLEVFAEAREHSARHASIRLAFEAVAEAARMASA
jgi:NifU-like protein involved in Fe-S cluster formation